MEYRTVEVLLGQGLDQKTDAKSTTQGKLVRCENVEFDKRFSLNKRRGFAAITLTNETLGKTPEELFSALATYDDELVIFGYDKIYALGDYDGALAGSRFIIERGIVPRGNTRIMHVGVGRTVIDEYIEPG